MSADTEIDAAYEAFEAAWQRLDRAVHAACPGTHKPAQHRDSLPPWCPACGRDKNGIKWGEPR